MDNSNTVHLIITQWIFSIFSKTLGLHPNKQKNKNGKTNFLQNKN